MSLCVYASSLYLRSQMLDASNSRPVWAYCVCISRALRDSKDWIRVMTLSLRSVPHKRHSTHPQTHLGFMVLNETCSRRKGPRGWRCDAGLLKCGRSCVVWPLPARLPVNWVNGKFIVSTTKRRSGQNATDGRDDTVTQSHTSLITAL